jgi:hypothetical protein
VGLERAGERGAGGGVVGEGQKACDRDDARADGLQQEAGAHCRASGSDGPAGCHDCGPGEEDDPCHEGLREQRAQTAMS